MSLLVEFLAWLFLDILVGSIVDLWRLLGGERDRGASELRQVPPPSTVGSGWYVFEHLADVVLRDSTALERMTPEQRRVFELNLVRQEVASGGFQGYFDATEGLSASRAVAGFELIAPPMAGVVKEALDLNEQQSAPNFESLDGLFSQLEEQLKVDSLVDAYVANHPEGFFR